MELFWFLLSVWVMFNETKTEEIAYSENIEYCTNIMYDPSMEQEFYNNCNLEETNRYIMDVKTYN